jgi:ketol-acid reductoisomerase
MTQIHHEREVKPGLLDGQTLAIVGYGNQGRPWALNLRDSGYDVTVCVRADETRDRATSDGFETAAIDRAHEFDIVCVLVPDDVIPSLRIERDPQQLTLLASGYCLAFDRFMPRGDVGMIAPRMLGPEVRRCYEEGSGFITAVGIAQDATGTALDRTLSIAQAIGGLKQGALALTPMQEAILDLSVEQLLSPALTHVNTAFVRVMLEQGIPLEAIMTELFYSGEVERNYRLLREVGFTGQLGFHSPTSQYGQLSRRGSYDALDVAERMRGLVEQIRSGAFADEWDAERDAGYRRLEELKQQHAGPGIQALEEDLRRRLGPDSTQEH